MCVDRYMDGLDGWMDGWMDRLLHFQINAALVSVRNMQKCEKSNKINVSISLIYIIFNVILCVVLYAFINTKNNNKHKFAPLFSFAIITLVNSQSKY